MLDLEMEMMLALGLSADPFSEDAFSGCPGCAADALPAVITHYRVVSGGSAIASPDMDVMVAVADVAEDADGCPEALVNLWLAILHALRAHIRGAEKQSSRSVRAAAAEIGDLFLPRRLTATRILEKLAAAQDDRLPGLKAQTLRRSFPTPRLGVSHGLGTLEAAGLVEPGCNDRWMLTRAGAQRYPGHNDRRSDA